MLLNIFQTDNEHCMLLALPCGRDEVDVLQQSKNLQTGFIMYLQQKQAAGIVNIAAPGSQQVREDYYIYENDYIYNYVYYCLTLLCFLLSLFFIF
jgi:hypothetical protein